MVRAYLIPNVNKLNFPQVVSRSHCLFTDYSTVPWPGITVRTRFSIDVEQNSAQKRCRTRKRRKSFHKRNAAWFVYADSKSAARRILPARLTPLMLDPDLLRCSRRQDGAASFLSTFTDTYFFEGTFTLLTSPFLTLSRVNSLISLFDTILESRWNTHVITCAVIFCKTVGKSNSQLISRTLVLFPPSFWGSSIRTQAVNNEQVGRIQRRRPSRIYFPS